MKIFLNKDSLETILLFPDIYPNLYKILSDKSKLIFDMSDDELDEILGKSESDIAQFLSGYNLDHEAKDGILQAYKSNVSLMTEEPRSLFLLDIDRETAKSISKDHGILVLSSNDIDDKIFDGGIFKFRIDENAEIGGTIHQNWINMLKDMRLLPFNTLVVSDSYLFNTANSNIEDCIHNIEGFLEAVLPEHLSEKIHVAFFTESIDSGKNAEIEKAIGDISAYIKSKRKNLDITFEYVFCKSLHQRKVISNYNVIIFDKGLLIFKKKGGGCHKYVKSAGENRVLSFSACENARRSSGQSEYSILTKDLKVLSKIYKDCRDLVNSDNPDPYKRILGTKKRDKTIVNRLINNYE